MQIVAIRDVLKNALSAAERVVTSTSNLPILKNLLMIAEKGGLIISATDLEIAITVRVAAKTIEEGKVCIPAGTLSQLIGNLPTDRVEVASREMDLLVKTDGYEGIVKGANPEEFPIIPSLEDSSNHLDISAAILQQALTQVLAASSTGENRQELSNILFDYRVDALKIAATDSFRLAEKSLSASQFSSTIQDPIKILLPVRSVVEIQKILSSASGIVEMYFDRSQMLLLVDDFSLISRISEARFPEYAAIIPKTNGTTVEVKKSDLGAALRLAGVLAEKNAIVSLQTNGTKGLEVQAQGQSIGEGKSILPAKVSGPSAENSYNVRHLADVLKVLSSDEISIGLNGERASVIKDPKDETYFYILAPILKS
jgi:DNA polymerase-3 subunit beta